jgi:hypothetical protein
MALLQPILKMADSQQKKCYIELTDVTTLNFFRKMGFLEIAQIPTDTSFKNPPTLIMIREPKPTK